MKIVERNINRSSIEGLQELFSRVGISIKTKQKISFELQPTRQLIGVFNLKRIAAQGINIDLITDYNSVEHLIEVHDLKNAEEIQRITVSDLWVRYLQGNGYVAVDIEGIDAEVCFRIVKSITMIYSGDLSFYQEVPRAMTMTHQFERFVLENMHRFVVAAGMRPLMLPEELWLP
jgi:hypothetical protein